MNKSKLLDEVEIFEEIPKGWKIIQGATTAPIGYIWINNNKSMFGRPKKYKHALLKIKEK